VTAGFLPHVHARPRTSLAGRWRAIVDPYDTGLVSYRGTTSDTFGWFQDRKPRSDADLVEYDFDRAWLLHVPGDWSSQRPELLFYEGAVWYRRLFRAGCAAGRRLFLHFGAANYAADVWLNGRRLGRHEGGFGPFAFEIGGALREGEQSLVVRVENRRRPEAVPTVNTDWWNYGGLTRDVCLVDLPETFVRDLVLQLAPGSQRELRGCVRLDGPRARQRVRVAIPAAGFAAELETDGDGIAEIRDVPLPAGLALWYPDRPALHEVVVEAETDRLADRIGFRSLAVRGSEILLNGEPIFLRGISLHAEALHEPRRAHGEGDARPLLELARELGCNAVRLAHYPHDDAMARVADELGLLVWAEIPVYWTIHWQDPGTLACAVQQLEELVVRDRNRASVILWSVGNEAPPTPERLAFLRELVATARRLDPTRLVTAALEIRLEDRHTIAVDDPLAADLDVLGVNEYVGWYFLAPDDARAMRWNVPGDKPLVVSEFGADAAQGLHGAATERWTEEYQAAVYEAQLDMLSKLPTLRGMTPWILKDFRSPKRPLGGVQDYFNRKGLVSERGERKAAFAVLERFYRERAAKGGA
jgi:beta-glucuronidase